MFVIVDRDRVVAVTSETCNRIGRIPAGSYGFLYFFWASSFKFLKCTPPMTVLFSPAAILP